MSDFYGLKSVHHGTWLCVNIYPGCEIKEKNGGYGTRYEIIVEDGTGYTLSYGYKSLTRDDESYIEYDGKKYLVPDNENIIINNFEISNNLGLSHLKISLNHQLLNENYEILINMN